MRYDKTQHPLDDVRRFLEPGPVVLISSSHAGRSNIMTMGWHMMMQFQPALFGCFIWTGNHSFEMIRKSGQCVINLPTIELAGKVVGVGNSTGSRIDKFREFDLTAVKADRVDAPLIDECYANFECRLADQSLIGKYGLFVWEIVSAHVATKPGSPKTMHYRGHGEFMVAGDTISFRQKFKPQNL
jgi:flavin reductase (DIM6/NTAB) family NADH-FMN oxidoreductase RutF